MLKFYFIFLQFSIILQKYRFSYANPLIGHNIEIAAENEFPFIVSIGYNDSSYTPEDNHFCTGSLITEKHVLTAAHCFNGYKSPGKIQVLIGSNSLKKGIPHEVTGWITYTDWFERRTNEILEEKYNDIAVLTLKYPVDTSKYTIGLLSTRQPEQLYGTRGILVGWGENESHETPENLRKTSVKILSNSACEKKVGTFLNENPTRSINTLCSDADPWVLVSCGDSGGPILDENKKIVGVTRGDCPVIILKPGTVLPNSWIYEYNKSKVNEHFSVYQYREFINDVTNSNKYV